MNGVFKCSPAGAAFVTDGIRAHDELARSMISGGQKEPFHIFDMDVAYQHIQRFKEAMPRVQIFYGKSILYAVTVKTSEQMMFARASGVKHTTFDSSCELKKLKQYWPDARLLIRIKVHGVSVYRLSDKFGCESKTEAIPLLEEAAALGLKVIGVAFHVGSLCSSVDSHVVGLRLAKTLFDHEARAGRGMSIVDIGGGFFSDNIDKIHEVSEQINDALEELFPDRSVQVIAEPGRYLCETSTTLYCNIVGMKRITESGLPENLVYLPDGIFGTLRCIESYHTVEKLKWPSQDEGELEDVILWGASGDSEDRIMSDVNIRLPRLTSFDWLVFPNRGAYSFVFSTRFARIEIPLIRAVISADLREKIKSSSVFNLDDFILNRNISEPLPSTLPLPQTSEDYVNGKGHVLSL